LTPAEATEDEGGVLLEDELEQNNKGEDVQEILMQIGVEQPITYPGCNICDLVKTRTSSGFTTYKGAEGRVTTLSCHVNQWTRNPF